MDDAVIVPGSFHLLGLVVEQQDQQFVGLTSLARVVTISSRVIAKYIVGTVGMANDTRGFARRATFDEAGPGTPVSVVWSHCQLDLDRYSVKSIVEERDRIC